MYINARLTKEEAALRQLKTAIRLYLENEDLISAITLAGAADEIFGELLRRRGHLRSIDRTVDRLCAMHQFAFNEMPKRKKYMELRDGYRKELKHLCNGKDLLINTERAANQMIRRAIENYCSLCPGYYPQFKAFEREWIRRHREQAAT